jgi:hypothetical protein
MGITSSTNQNLNSTLTFNIGISLTVFCFLLLGCGGSTQKDQWRVAELKPSGSGKTAVPGKSVKEPSSLPPSAEINRSLLRPLVETFKSQQPQNFNALNATTVGKAYSLTIVAKCDLDVLKGFIAKGWAPIVPVRTGSRSQLWAMVGYRASDEILLENPINNRRRTLTEEDFKTQWEFASNRKCALITPGRLDQAKVRMALNRYLPQSKVAQVKVLRSLKGRAPVRGGS